jgi:quercetin dioxygenase-like cupin family protein
MMSSPQHRDAGGRGLGRSLRRPVWTGLDRLTHTTYFINIRQKPVRMNCQLAGVEEPVNETTLSAPIFRPSGTGAATWAMGSLFEHLVSGADTGGELGVSLVLQPPGTATPLHLHSRESEAFYLLSGTMSYRAGEQTYRMSAGDFIYLPQGVPHAFRITGDQPAQVLAMTVPGGLLALYDEVGLPAFERRLPGADGRTMDDEIARWNDSGPRFGLTVVGPPIPADDATAL